MSPLFHIMFEFFKSGDANFFLDIVWGWLKLVLCKGMHPIPILVVVEVAIDIGLI